MIWNFHEVKLVPSNFLKIPKTLFFLRDKRGSPVVFPIGGKVHTIKKMIIETIWWQSSDITGVHAFTIARLVWCGATSITTDLCSCLSYRPIDRSVTKGHLITRPHLQACQSKIFQRWRQHFICCRWVVIIEAIRNCVRVDVRSHLVQREESLDFYPVKNRVERFCVAEEKQCACVYVRERE